jgi:pyrroline-5-carboxylate reductase
MEISDMTLQHSIAFIGGGVMAEAMIKGLLNRELLTGAQVWVSDPREERGRELVVRYGLAYTPDNAEAAAHAEIVVIAVKPQTFAQVGASLGDAAVRARFVLSILAGVRSSTLAEGVRNPNIVRAMPNTPAQIGQGFTVWTATPAMPAQYRAEAQMLLSALGDELYTHEEKFLDMATALSGSGPTYVYLFVESLIDAGVHMGFSRQDAERLVLHTLRGSVAYALESDLHPAALRYQVTSPGGTSAAALYELERGGLRTVIADAVWAAYKRSVELGDAGEKAARPGRETGRDAGEEA